jgi:hypothetical protein
MERIRIYKIYSGLAKFFLIFGSIFSLFGLLLLTNYLINGFNTQLLSGDWISVIFTFQGFLFIIMGYSNLKSRKYYIEWDDEELRFLLPGSKKPETIRIHDIQSVCISLFEIELKLMNNRRILNLDNLQFEDIRKVKEKFESICKTKLKM